MGAGSEVGWADVDAGYSFDAPLVIYAVENAAIQLKYRLPLHSSVMLIAMICYSQYFVVGRMKIYLKQK